MAKLVKKIIPASIALFLCTFAGAQQDITSISLKIQENPEYSGGFYRNYPAAEVQPMTVPEGYIPFYISHYGRHGSRWISDRIIYDRTSILLEKAAKAGALTPEGEELRERFRIMRTEAEGREGELSPQGRIEHRGIAERMYRHWPEVFAPKDGKPAEIDSRATVYTRCIYSMISFDERLKELDPGLKISRKAHKRDLTYMADYSHTGETYKASLQVSDSLARAWIHPDRFLSNIFSDPEFIAGLEKPQTAMFDLFHLASSQQATGRQDMGLYAWFTADEIEEMWKVLSTQTYIEEGPSIRFGKGNLENARNLLENIVKTADEVIAGKRTEAATLRFGHESNIVPLLSLIGLPQTSFREEILQARNEAAGKTAWSAELELASARWNISEICPMATNLQFIFFRTPEGKVKVRVLHNEKDAQLPVEGAPFYDWTVLKTYFEGRISN